MQIQRARKHPIAFHKGQDLGKIPKKLPAARARFEEAFEVRYPFFLSIFNAAMHGESQVEEELGDDADEENRQEAGGKGSRVIS